MHLSPLQLMSDSHFLRSGNVTIHPSVAIASGVLLHADPGSELVIGEGVCIGRGAILHAYSGVLEVEAGVILGAGVLIVGSVKIGSNACIGAMTTILESSVEPEQVVPFGSLVGDSSRRIAQLQATEGDASKTDESSNSPANQSISTSNGTASETVSKQVYGQAYVSRLMVAMFPHHQSLNSLPSNPQSSDGDV